MEIYRACASGSSIDTSGLTATAADIVAPKTAITADGEVTGLIGTDIFTINQNRVAVDFWDLQDYLSGVEIGLAIGGDLSNLPPLQSEPRFGVPIIYLPNGANITGDLSDIPDSSYVMIVINNAASLTGDLSSVPLVQYNLELRDCVLVSGIYTPSSTVQVVSLAGTNMSSNDIDQTLINLAAITEVSGSVSVPTGRTSTSDAAVATLTGLGWTVQEGS